MIDFPAKGAVGHFQARVVAHPLPLGLTKGAQACSFGASSILWSFETDRDGSVRLDGAAIGSVQNNVDYR